MNEIEELEWVDVPVLVPDRTSSRPPFVNWIVTRGSNGVRYTATLNGRACREVYSIAKEKGIQRVGIRIRQGKAPHEDRFALRVEEYRGRRDPFVVALSDGLGRSLGARFAAGALSRIQATGYSLLERQGDMMVGQFGTLRSPNSKGRRNERKGRTQPATSTH